MRQFSKKIHYVFLASTALYMAKMKKHYNLIDEIVERSELTEEQCLKLFEKNFDKEAITRKEEDKRMEFFQNEGENLKESLKKRGGVFEGIGGIEKEIKSVILRRNFKAAFDFLDGET